MSSKSNRTIVLLLGLVVLLCVGGSPSSAQGPAPNAGPSPDEDWPRVHTVDSGQVVMYQPQIEDWQDYKSFKATAALQVIPTGKESGAYGALHLEADTQVNNQTRMVLVHNIKVTNLTFPGSSPEVVEESTRIANDLLAKTQAIVISLDRLIAAMDVSNLQQPPIEVNLDPPPIYYSAQDAILVMFVGEPKFEAIKGTDLMFAANTNWDLLLDSPTVTYYLLDDESWLQTKDVANGPWQAVEKLPDSLSQLPDDDNWKEVKKQIPGKPIQDVPKVFVAKQPSELIVTEGEPAFSPISGTGLMFVTNTDTDLFLDPQDKNYYFLTAGRWFRAQSLEGPWSAASKDLPEDFSNIPPEHEMGHVLASVPGSSEADAAILLSSIPEKATVNRKEVTLQVAYDEEPKFAPIESTQVSYAVNTPESVFLVEGRYYCCHQGVWFESSDPKGPWEVCDSVPDEIYSIPADHPKHNVTYVYVYDSNPETVTTGYTSGYTGAYVAATGALMFGLGYWAANELDDDDWPYYSYAYGPAYWGYGCAAHYDYYQGGYARASQYYGPYGGAGRAAAYNPATGTYARGAYAYGPYGSASAKAAYNPYTDRYAAGAKVDTPYGSWGRGVVSSGDQWAQAGYRSTSAGTVAGARTSQGGAIVAGESNRTGESGAVGKNKYGDVYVGKDGNVYKRDSGSGDWSKSDGQGGWTSPDQVSPRSEDRQARTAEGGQQFDRSQAGANREAGQQPRSEDFQSRVNQSQQQLDRSQLQANRQPGQAARTENLQSRVGQTPQQLDRSQLGAGQGRGQAGTVQRSQLDAARGSAARGGSPAGGLQGGYGQQSRQMQAPSNMDRLNHDARSRQTGDARARNYQQAASGGRGGAGMSTRSQGGGGRSMSGGSRGGGGGGRGGGGGGRGGGGRR